MAQATRGRRTWWLRGCALAALAGGALLGPASGCTEAPIQVPLRSLQSSGPVAFLCLGDPAEGLDGFARPLTECTSSKTESVDDYVIPHLYTLVTQPLTGEVAVVDLTTTDNGAVIDQDPSTPGSNFLPVGAVPTDVVCTPGGSASFVAVSETNFEAIFALPSDMIRGGDPRLTSWPSCALPAAPDRMHLVLDPADDDGLVRPSCDAGYGDADADAGCRRAEQLAAGCLADPFGGMGGFGVGGVGGVGGMGGGGGGGMGGGDCDPTPHCHGDLARDAERVAKPGRYKLLVSIPSEGGIAIVDAQDILDQDAGARAPCNIERWLPLSVDIAPAPPAPPAPPAAACVPKDSPDPGAVAGAFAPRPAGMAHDGTRLYVADRGAPVIHRLDVASPCDPFELPPLATRSDEEPERVVVTSRVAVSPLTLDLRRYLYAIDVIDGSVMVYDVSDDSPSAFPLQRPFWPQGPSSPQGQSAASNPFQPVDRLRFQFPPRDIVIVQHQNDAIDPITGSTVPVRCDADPSSSGPGSVYRTSDDFESGAGPANLRGVFAFVVLETGDIVVVDIDDYDAACRGPKNPNALFGCQEPIASEAAASGEYSCNAVAPHQARARGFLVTADNIASNQPSINSVPALFDQDGTIVKLDENVLDGNDSPRMRATTPTSAPTPFDLAVGNDLEPLDPATGLFLGTVNGIDPGRHTLAMNLTDPRAHVVNQKWTVSFEGALRGFSGRFGELIGLDDNQFRLREHTVGFCTRGVMSQTAIAEQLVAEGASPAAASSLADYVQLTTNAPVEADPYWTQQDACTFNACQARYGNSDAPLAARDLRIVEAYEGELLIEPRGQSGTPAIKCCFPGVVEFRVRAGNQWVVDGEGVGFLHHVVIDDEGRCRPSCDPNRALMNGRVREAPAGPLADDDPLAFHNPFFRFAINAGASVRDMQFRFSTSGEFTPLTLSIAVNDPDVQPTNARYLPNTGELVVSDGSLEGIVLLDLNALAVTAQHN